MTPRESFRSFYTTFWTGKTGRLIVAAGKDATILACYLISSPHGNLSGLYYLPSAYLEHDTKLTVEDIRRACDQLAALDFAHYDWETEWVWVVNGLAYQADYEGGKTTKDNRVKGAIALADRAPDGLRRRFLARYATLLPSPLEAPSTLQSAPPEAPPGIQRRTEIQTDTGTPTLTGDGTGGPMPVGVGREPRLNDLSDEHLSAEGVGERIWQDWRETWETSGRPPLPLPARKSDEPRLLEIGTRYPERDLRCALMLAYLTSGHKPIREKPYTLGMFLHWAPWLEEQRKTAQAGQERVQEWLNT